MNDSKNDDETATEPLLLHSSLQHTPPPRSAFLLTPQSSPHRTFPELPNLQEDTNNNVISSSPAGNNSSTAAAAENFLLQENRERQVQLVLLRTLGIPYASHTKFWLQSLPVSVLLGLLTGWSTLAFLASSRLLFGLWLHHATTPDEPEQHQSQEGDWKWIIVTTFGGCLAGLVLLLPGAPRLGTTRTIFHDAVDLQGHPVEMLYLVLSCLISLAAGAPLGPEMAIGAIGSSWATWLSQQKVLLRESDRRTEVSWVVSGMAASLGSLFPSPLLGVVIVHELSVVGRPHGVSLDFQVSRETEYTLYSGAESDDDSNNIINDANNMGQHDCDSDFMEQITLAGTAATVAYVTIYLLVPRDQQLWNPVAELGNDEFALWHLAAAIPLGVCCAVLGSLTLVLIGLSRSARIMTCRFLNGILGFPVWVGHILFPTLAGAIYGMVAIDHPYILGTGIHFIKEFLDKVASNEDNDSFLNPSLLISTALLKIVTMSICLGFGLVGGPIFPLVFAGLCVGLALSSFFPVLPICLTVPCCMSAIPGSFVAIPFTLVFFVCLALSLTAEQTGPVFVATIVAFTFTGGLGLIKWAGMKQLGVPPRGFITQRQESWTNEEHPPTDDDILRGIRSAIFGE